MLVKDKNIPDTATGDTTLASSITDKKGYATRWQGSVRWVDLLLARGLPHLKIGARRVRILIPEADAWMKEQYGTQRLSRVKGNGNNGAQAAKAE
jgi:hypothetical protein